MRAMRVRVGEGSSIKTGLREFSTLVGIVAPRQPPLLVAIIRERELLRQDRIHDVLGAPHLKPAEA